MNGLIILLGESFRLGTQGTRNIGNPESYTGQINACDSHIKFIEDITQKFNMNNMSVFISSYDTQYSKLLIDKYKKYLIWYNLNTKLIGLANLFNNSINMITNITKYDFILHIRIDLFLKPYFTDIFNPKSNMILFSSICWKRDSTTNGHPRVNPMTIFIPKKYYNYINHLAINYGHDLCYILIKTTDLTYKDLDTMINTYHDSDSFKDFNPLYYIVNRPENTICDTSSDFKFNKYHFRKCNSNLVFFSNLKMGLNFKN